jgi:hypothetical protein
MGERIDLAALKALAKAATPGPWHTGPTTPAGNVWVYANGEPIGEPDPSRTGYRAWFTLGFGRKVRDSQFTAIQNIRAKNAEADAAYIAAVSPEVVLAWIEHTRRLETQNKDLLDKLKWCYATMHKIELIADGHGIVNLREAAFHAQNYIAAALAGIVDTNEGDAR